MSQVSAIFSSMVSNIDDDMEQFSPLKNTCNSMGIKPSYIVIAFIAIMIIMTVFGIFSHIFITIFGIIYPAYMSFKAINTNSQPKCKKWLTYWIVFGFLTAFDTILKFLLFFIPGYYTLKAIFCLWMFYPRTDGAKIIYENFLKPQLEYYKKVMHKQEQKKY